jgi:hypothetical protein
VKYQEVDTYGGYLTITTRSIKQGEPIVVDYGGDFFPKCICDTCAGPSIPRMVGKAMDNREESMEGKFKRKREKAREKAKRRKINKAERSTESK